VNGDPDWGLLPELRADVPRVRTHNLGLILRLLAAQPQSRAALARGTGLNRSTVSSLVEQLEVGGFVRDGDQPGATGPGRPARPVELNPDGALAIGIEISIDYCSVHAVDLAGTTRFRAFVGQDNRLLDPQTVVEQMAALIAQDETVRKFAQRRRPLNVTVALPGLVDGSNGSLVVAPNLAWQHAPVRDFLDTSAAAHDVDIMNVHVDNEANLGALAEMRCGAATDLTNFAYILGEMGVGAAIVHDRRVFRGAHGFAGEFGHMVISNDTADAESRSLESAIGQASLMARTGIGDATGPVRSAIDWPGSEIAALARKGDHRVREVVRDVGHLLGMGLANLTNLIDVEAFVLDGFFVPLQEWIRRPIQDALAQTVVSYEWSPPQVRFSGMNGDAPVRGAAYHAQDALLREIPML
jgi:predicted NBD/HSP70 family sugar kinase